MNIGVANKCIASTKSSIYRCAVNTKLLGVDGQSNVSIAQLFVHLKTVVLAMLILYGLVFYIKKLRLNFQLLAFVLVK